MEGAGAGGMPPLPGVICKARGFEEYQNMNGINETGKTFMSKGIQL